MRVDLHGRTVLLTGAAGGIGRVLAKAFLDCGASVVAADVDAAGRFFTMLRGRFHPYGPARMAPPMLWLCTREADAVSGKRYIATQWDEALSPEAARGASESPVGWPELAAAPVWPGGKPT